MTDIFSFRSKGASSLPMRAVNSSWTSLMNCWPGVTVLKSVTPGQQFIKLVHEELTALMGSEEAPLDLKEKMSVIMVCGLQGSGKTTSCAKLAAYIGKTEKDKKILLA